MSEELAAPVANADDLKKQQTVQRPATLPPLATVAMTDLQQFINAQIRAAEQRFLNNLTRAEDQYAALWTSFGALKERITELERPGDIPPGKPASDSPEVERLVKVNLANARSLLAQTEGLLRSGDILDEGKRKNLLFDIEALKDRC